MFHFSACDGLGDAGVDVIDYCVRHMAKVVAGYDDDDEREVEKRGLLLVPPMTETPLEEIQRHDRTTYFQIAMKCLSVLRYLSDHLVDLPLSMTSRMVVTHDVPELLVRCLVTRPWIMRGRRRKEKQEEGCDDSVFQGSEWQPIHDPTELPKLEGQCWLALYNLLSKRQCAEKYELSEHRRDILLCLLPHLEREHLRDQVCPSTQAK